MTDNTYNYTIACEDVDKRSSINKLIRNLTTLIEKTDDIESLNYNFPNNHFHEDGAPVTINISINYK